MTFRMICLAPLLLAASSQAQTPAAATSTYRSDALKLSFAYPSSFTSPKGESSDKDAGKTKSCVTNPVRVMDMATGFNMIFVRNYDTACAGEKLTASGFDLPTQEVLVANAFVNSTLSSFGKPKMGAGASYELAKKSAYVMTGSVKVPNSTGKNVLYSAAACVIAGKNIGCFEFVSNDCANLASLVSSAITFDGSAAEPAIPAKVALGCKAK